MTPGSGAEIRTVPVESGSGQMRAGQQEVFLKTAGVLSFPAFSTDGKWLAFADAPAGSYEVYVRAFPDKGTQVQISNAGGIVAHMLARLLYAEVLPRVRGPRN
jgi:Tol biopolymer transport system component